MKSLKFEHELAQQILKGEKTSTWRINDDKDLSVDDKVVLIDKVDSKDKESWVGIGIATINEVQQKRLGDINPSVGDGHETYLSKEAMYETYRSYYGDSIGPKTPIKVIHFSFVPYEHKKQLAEVDDKKSTELTEIKTFTDGGSRGNPGPSASGFVLLDMADNIIMKRGVYLGITTNNQAEYQALRLALEEAKERGAKSVHVFMDSLLVVNQMLGIFKVKNRDLWPIYEAIKQLAHSFQHVSFQHVPRELNKLADAMVNEALDAELQGNSP